MNTNEFDSRTHIGFICDCTSRDIKCAVGRGLKETNAIGRSNLKNAWLVGYLVRQKEPVFQKDLEKIFHFPKSTLADIIQALEKEGLIAKAPVDGDGRKKQIVVTEKGLEFADLAEAQIMDVEDYILKGISGEELDLVISILKKLGDNARDYKSDIDLLKKED